MVRIRDSRDRTFRDNERGSRQFSRPDFFASAKLVFDKGIFIW